MNAGWFVAKNGDQNAYNPGRWSFFEWTYFGDGQDAELWYCHTVFDASSAEDAKAADRADASDPATGGCGTSNFRWTKLIPVD